jgi:ribonucleoside-diphosphate reductase alpha chain
LNCFVMSIAEDSLDGIFTAIKEGALTLQEGGGVGYDFSVLRPYGAPVVHAGTSASGPVSFMRIWDAMCSVMLSTGARRGAMMGVLRCDHPDIEAFIEAKRDAQMLRHFNVSVMVSDEFMRAVRENKLWPLVFPVSGKVTGDVIHRVWSGSTKPVPCQIYRMVSAQELWEKIIRSAYDCAEPGVLFADTINRMNTLWYREQITATNPCGEIPLPAYGACDLGSINLMQFVQAAFTDKAAIDWKRLDETVSIATRFLDNVLDVSQYPLPVQQEQAQGTRRIGLGVTGLADMFVMLGIRYGSDESITLAKQLMQRIASVTWQTSIELAKEKAVFPFYHDDYLCGEFVESLEKDIREQLAKYGTRNSHHNTIAPAGTISLLANNVSNGIEPIFQAEYHRYMRVNDQDTEKFHVQDAAYRLWREAGHKNDRPPAWVDVGELTPAAHLAIQSAMQPFIDNAISKTINLPADFPFEQLTDVYTQAYALGLKGCTVFRPNAVTGVVLEEKDKEKTESNSCCQHD